MYKGRVSTRILHSRSTHVMYGCYPLVALEGDVAPVSHVDRCGYICSPKDLSLGKEFASVPAGDTEVQLTETACSTRARSTHDAREVAALTARLPHLATPVGQRRMQLRVISNGE